MRVHFKLHLIVSRLPTRRSRILRTGRHFSVQEYRGGKKVSEYIVFVFKFDIKGWRNSLNSVWQLV
jgi:hypothetical protein